MEKPDERTLQAGFGLGGPIVQDRADFYFNYERDEEDIGGRSPASTATVTTTAPTGRSRVWTTPAGRFVSEIGALKAAVPFGIDGEGFVGLDISIQYNIDLGGARSVGLFWDIFNLTNRTNFNNPTGNRSSGNFLEFDSTNFPRQMQVGARFIF